ncbi:hypothetical protein NLX83_08280 [Allokutzneria sp. A3M-2-11 16]|uniref:hypothetical protein n=1 Tax=Allokutzneria sp. A3M-2-11 16 TaxID=2962043 RepID=UPI0020B8C64D|nr:hypothetical protein [Allokutzneria sp. A3M-2-11 16]MCP3799252.1 hypothetical protein [Allokutzneria sp. A3M-2-11 16]
MTEGGGISGDPRWRGEWTAIPTREEATRPGTLRIDRDKIPQAIALFRSIRNRMDDLAEEAKTALIVEPMAADRVSAYAAEMLTAKGLTEPECAYNAIAAFRDQLQGMIDRLEETQRMMATMEHTNVEGFRRGQGG